MEVRQNRIRVEAGSVAHVGLKAEPDELAPRTAIPQRTFPVFPVATNQVQAGDPASLRLRRGLVLPKMAEARPPGAVGVIERERAFSTGTDDQDVLITFERLTPLLGRKAQVGRRRGKTAAAPWQASSALVPLLVVTMSVFPRTAWPVISRGLLPR